MIFYPQNPIPKKRQKMSLSEHGLGKGYSAPFPTDSHHFPHGFPGFGSRVESFEAWMHDDGLGVCDGKAMMVDLKLTFWRNWRLMEGWFNIHLMWSNMIYNDLYIYYISLSVVVCWGVRKACHMGLLENWVPHGCPWLIEMFPGWKLPMCSPFSQDTQFLQTMSANARFPTPWIMVEVSHS